MLRGIVTSQDPRLLELLAEAKLARSSLAESRGVSCNRELRELPAAQLIAFVLLFPLLLSRVSAALICFSSRLLRCSEAGALLRF